MAGGASTRRARLDLFAKILSSGLLFLAYLREIGIPNRYAVLGALCYALNGYLIINGQWDPHGTEVPLYALLLLAIERCLRTGNGGFLIVAGVLVGMDNPFSLYTCSIFCALYVVARQFITGDVRPFRQFGASAGRMAGFYCLGLMLTAPLLFPNLAALFDSPRVSGAGTEQIEIFRASLLPNDRQALFSMVAGLFDKSILGVGNGYTGWGNFFEAPGFYIGLLPLLLVTQLLDSRCSRSELRVGRLIVVITARGLCRRSGSAADPDRHEHGRESGRLPRQHAADVVVHVYRDRACLGPGPARRHRTTGAGRPAGARTVHHRLPQPQRSGGGSKERSKCLGFLSRRHAASARLVAREPRGCRSCARGEELQFGLPVRFAGSGLQRHRVVFFPRRLADGDHRWLRLEAAGGGDHLHRACRHDSGLMPVLGVKYLLSRGGQAPPGWRFAHQVAGISIFEDPTAEGIAQFRTRSVSTADMTTLPPEQRARVAQGAVIVDARITPRIGARVTTPAAAMASPERAGSTRLLKWENKKLTAVVDARTAGMVVISVPFDPGWTAEMDGQCVQTAPVNYGFIGIEIPPGQHTIKLRYRPAYRLLGWAAFTAALLLLAAASYRRLRLRRGTASGANRIMPR